MNKLQRYASRYLSFGWNVLPCAKDTKYPMLPWQPYQTVRVTPGLWEKYPQAGGIALLTGELSGIIVVDVDTKDNPLGLESSVVARTQSGGTHYYYRWEQALHNTVRIEDAPVDFRGDGGLVIIPPTVYQGRSYEWIKAPTKENLAELPNLPEALKKYLESVKTVSKREAFDWQKIIGVKEGARDDYLFRAACSLCRKFAEPLWVSIVLPTLRTINKTFDPPLPDADVEAKFSGGSQFIKSQQKVVEELDDPTKYSTMTNAEKTTFEKRLSMPFGVSSLDKFFTFPTGFYIVCGHPGSGKGWFALWLARVFFRKHRRKTMFYSLEMGEQLVRTRLLQAWSDLTQKELERGGADVKAALDLMDQDAITIYEFGKTDPKSQQVPANFKKKLAKQYAEGYRVFMFDHLHEIAGANVNDTNQKVVEDWGNVFQQIAKEYPDIWLAVFAQPNSASARKKILTKNDILGSKSIGHKCEYVLSLNRPTEDDEFGEARIDASNRRVYLYFDKNRTGTYQHFGVWLNFLETGNFIVETQDGSTVNPARIEPLDTTYEYVKEVFKEYL